MKRLFLFLAGSFAFAANVDITVVGTTQTQIMLSYDATTTDACALTATDNNGGPSVADLDATKFMNANQDLSRTVANGFLWPTLVNGLHRTVVIGTHDQIKKGLDGNSYSTALQTNSDHTITVACNGGADSGTVHAQTQNIPYASYYPELPLPDPTQITFGMTPTINWTDSSVKYIDPITGVLMQRITGPADTFDDSNPAAMVFATPVIDVNGSAWTNPSNFITKQVSGTLATTSTAGAPLFAPFDPSFGPNPTETWSDFQVVPYGSASSNAVVATFCISLNSGQTCDSLSPINVTYGTSARAYTAIPSSWPSAYFSGWGGMGTWFGAYDLVNRTFSGVSCSGSTCTLGSPAGQVGFQLDRVAGSKFQISNCASGTDTTLTILTVDNWSQITTQQSGLSLQNCTYRDLSVGIRVTLNSAGTLNASISGFGVQTRSAQAGSSGSRYTGALSKVTDIATDCNGTSRNPPISGYLFGLAAQGIYLMQDDGISCLQSSLYNRTSHIHLQILPSGKIPFTDARCFILPDFENPQHIWKGCHVPNNYQRISAGYPAISFNDNFTYTDLGTTATGIGAKVIAAGGTAATALSSGIWPPLGLDDIGDDGLGNAVLQYRATSNGQDSECILAWADGNNNLISALTMWGNYPVGYAACHFGGTVSGGYSFFSSQAEQSQISPIKFSTAALLGGPFVSRSTAGMYKNGSLTTWSIPISACTSTNPVVCTSNAHDLDNVTAANGTQGALINISGATGAGWNAINGLVYAHRLDNDRFSLYTDPVGASAINGASFGAFSGAVTATMLPPLYSVNIANVINNGGNARMVANLSGGYMQYFPSGKLVIRDGDPIAITQTYLNSTTQYYAKVTGVPNGDFDVYRDAALTSPAPYSALSGASGWYATLAEACPDPSSVSLPGPLFMDTGFGTSGAGKQKIRCVTIQVHDEACSDFASMGEQAVYPCGSDPGNPKRSSLHPIMVGDAFGDLSHIGGNHEILYVLAVNRISTNQINVTLLRIYGDDPNYGWRGATNGLTTDYYAQQHSAGWTLIGEGPIPGGLIHTTSMPTFAIPPVNGAHNDFVAGFVPGNVSLASAFLHGVSDSRINVPIGTLTGPGSTLHSSFPYWAAPDNPAALTGLAQSYPSMRMIFGQAPPSEINGFFSWNSDWMAMNGAFGNPQNNGDGVGLARTLTKIRGGMYDPGSTTSIVYLIPVMSPSVNVKIAPMLVTNWPHSMLRDISGPGTLITDANEGTYCVVFTAGECRPGSMVGQVFAAIRRFSDSYAQCIANDMTLGSPCAFGLSPHGGWMVQVRNYPIDTRNLGVRRLSLGWTMPLSHYDFSNWISSPDAKWGLFAGNAIQQHPPKGIYSGSQWFAMKLPPSPAADTTDRTKFVPVRISLKGVSGDSVRIAFGYAENGNPENFYCTTRAEACYTSTSATITNPFAFASEAQSSTSCSSTCEVVIPAIPGRILYYMVQRQNGSSITTSAPGVVAVD